ncbi:hypothetical protein FACS1894113_1840 [Alphaproteobacteria bacterium]|nr:hypothetical protein FACS1894113_1840 [Alphaproteobacteria bacterium]
MIPPDKPDSPKSSSEIANKSIKRFSVGVLAGLLIAALQWGSYIYFFDEQIPLYKGIIFCLLLSIICGLMTLKWGYKTLESLIQLLG